MEERILNFSQEAVKERKRNNYLLMFMMPVMMVFFACILVKVRFDGDINITLFASILSIFAIIMLAEMFVVFRIMIKKLKQSKLIVSDTSLTREGGKFREIISYEEIQKINVKRDKSNRILYIIVKRNRKNINLSGFENMDYLLEHLKMKLNDESRFTEIKNKINWNSPIAMVVMFCGVILAFCILVVLDFNLYAVFNIYFPIVIGIYLLICKPISKNAGARFRIFETIASCIIIACGVLKLLL